MAARQIVVLVVEDESLVRISIVTELEDNGLKVLEAGNALEAIAILDGNVVVDVMFTDVDMPSGLNGLELARIVKERYPMIHVIVTSGPRDVRETDLPAPSRFFQSSMSRKRSSGQFLRLPDGNRTISTPRPR